jgi:6-phosphogluconolactonase
MPPLTTFADRDALMCATADRIAAALSQGIAQRGFACAALSGGGTPEPAYALLASQSLDWARIIFALVDERFVPPEHEGSNEKMLRRALAPALAQGAKLLPMYVAGSTADAAASADQLYDSIFIDIAVMGMGGDGHTASWFPGVAHEVLDLANPRTVIHVYAPQAAGAPDRLTLTRVAYNRAGGALLLLTGEDKRARLAGALSEPLEDAPVAALFAPGSPPIETLWAA